MVNRHPNVFLIECKACLAPRVALPSNLLVCVACDRTVKDGLIVGPPLINQSKEIPSFRRLGNTWNVLTDKA